MLLILKRTIYHTKLLFALANQRQSDQNVYGRYRINVITDPSAKEKLTKSAVVKPFEEFQELEINSATYIWL